jgi:hypothetical protein
MHAHAPHIPIGEAIERLGSAIAAGDTSTEEAVLELRSVDPSLTTYGAEQQLKSWRGAAAREAAATSARTCRVAGPGDARQVSARPALHFHCRRGA